MNNLIYKDSRGAIKADEHYRNTGHRIIQNARIIKKFSKIEKINEYICDNCNCDFKSYAGEIREAIKK